MFGKIKRIFIVLALVLFFLGGFIRNPVVMFSSKPKSLTRASAAELENHARTIVGVKPFRKHSNIESLNRVAAYIKQNFDKNCDNSSYQTFTVQNNEYKNVICRFNGEVDKKIIIGAHYDVAFEQDGADDNASGTASIIELSRLLKIDNQKPHYALEIVAYTLEEPPYFGSDEMGSYFHAKSLKDRSDKVKFMISIEMIGYFSDEWLSQGYPSPLLYLYYPIKGNFIALIGGLKEYLPLRRVKKSFAEAMETPVYSINGPSVIPGVDYSDHLHYWNMGYDAYMLTDTSFYRNNNYHKKTDTIDTLNFDKMADITNGIYNLSLTNQ